MKNDTKKMLTKLHQLNDIARSTGQKLSQLALSWILRDGIVTTVLIDASSPAQIKENVEAVDKFSLQAKS
jgi:L-glyceraldehyde 3-phosphate reductase